MFSIDQNCHSLWDVPPKLQALTYKGHRVRHFIEDIDVAFTSLGAGGEPSRPRLARERYHHSGGADWGTAMFYCEFLGKLPVDVRDWEPLTGLKTAALAKQLGRSVQDLFDEFSPSDNWQLIGSSYLGDRLHHRVIGDLSVAETAEFLRELMDKARSDMLRAFPGPDAQSRLGEWFSGETGRLEGWLREHADGTLVDLYRTWLGHYVGKSVALDLASSLFACPSGNGTDPLLAAFLTDYDTLAGLYNEAIAETDTKLRPLMAAHGELPFFAAFDHRGHFVRSGMFLRDGELIIGERAFALKADRTLPSESLRSAGIRCLAGKAIVLIIQVRRGARGGPLALPHRGSMYMPAASRFAEKLASRGLLDGQLHPIVRVRFGLLDAMKTVDTIIRLPAHLTEAFGAEQLPARKFAADYAALSAEAGRRLESLKTPPGRKQWQSSNFPQLVEELAELDRRRRDQARSDPAPEKIRPLWQRAKAVQTELLSRGLRMIARDSQLSQIDYWDSRGALLPWSIALGGEMFYNELIRQAQIRPEPLPGHDDG